MFHLHSRITVRLLLVLAIACVTADAQSRSPQSRTRPSGGQRAARGLPSPSGQPAATFPFEFRTIDGHGNNVSHNGLGAAGEPFLRLLVPDYADGVSQPSGANRPSAREVSNVVHSQTGSMPNGAGATDYLWQWGQFLDHDIDETPGADPQEAFDIMVPAGDPLFDPFNTGTATIPLNRSAWEMVHGVRQQVNEITAFIDASNVYGSDDARALALRTLDGTGRLATSPGNLLPYNVDGLPNANSPSASFFLAGDVRANEQIGLIAMHTLFVREHNFWADVMPLLGISDGDTIYELARAIVAAEMQAITFNEFLPLLLGVGAMPPYTGYDDGVDPGISNEFATAAYRVGHTMLSNQLVLLDANGPTSESPLPLADAFFSPTTFVDVGLDPILRGLAAQKSQTIDPFVIDGVRNFLFGPPGAGGFDLASLNIQRGRDHGLPSYARLRAEFGPGSMNSFSDISSSSAIVGRLSSVYASVHDIDPWVGLLSEDHVPGALVGDTLHAILLDQFRRLRDGDRFWYQAYMETSLAAFIDTQTLAVIIRRNTGIGAELPNDVFRGNNP